MTPERRRRVEELYHAALTRGEDDRRVFLSVACAGDETLRHEVESLLAQPASDPEFLMVSPLRRLNCSAVRVPRC